MSAPTTNHSLIFNAVPTAFPVPREHLKKVASTFDLDAPLASGSVLVKTVALSLDPYLRGRMRAPEIESYAPPFALGKPLSNFGVSEIIRSESSSFKVGDHLYGSHDFSEYQTFDAEALKEMRLIDNQESLPWTYWVGAAGMPGQTAWYGLENIAKPQKGETIFISAASGAVGQMVALLCQRLGVKIIGSAGSDEKVAFLRDVLKFDVAFNYKTDDAQAILAANPFEIYWDNTGGPQLDAVLATIKEFGRIVACGTISTYNGETYGLKGSSQFFAKSLKLEGFIVIKHDLSKFYDTVPGYIANGEMPKPKEHITIGLDNGEAMLDLLQGRNFGKAVYSLE